MDSTCGGGEGGCYGLLASPAQHMTHLHGGEVVVGLVEVLSKLRIEAHCFRHRRAKGCEVALARLALEPLVDELQSHSTARFLHSSVHRSAARTGRGLLALVYDLLEDARFLQRV
jgi:hypothetical protein